MRPADIPYKQMPMLMIICAAVVGFVTILNKCTQTTDAEKAVQAKSLTRLAEVIRRHPELINKPDRDNGFTPLHWAVYESLVTPGAQEVAKLLVFRGADINARDKEGSTPLFWALWQRNRDLADFLLAHGADPAIKGKENLTPLELARRFPGAD